LLDGGAGGTKDADQAGLEDLSGKLILKTYDNSKQAVETVLNIY
jgi:hypothetical protein